MSASVHPLPTMPEIGRAESYYARQIHDADKAGDDHLRESMKVGQYITLAIDPHLEWEQKLRYLEHALRRHCQPPPLPSDSVWMFYAQLRDLVRQHAGQEALRIASKADDEFAQRIRDGESPSEVEFEARRLFGRIMSGGGEHKPDQFSEEDWHQLCLLRSQWV